MQSLSCWVVTDGKPGMENQCLGLAEALGLAPVVKRIRLHSPWRQLSPWLNLGSGLAICPQGDPLAPPWPELMIATGRLSVVPALHVKRMSRGRTYAVQIQDPTISSRHFDLVVVPEHDRLRGPNVLVTRGALHRVTAARLGAEAERLAARYAHLPRPRIAVLVGGDNGAYRMTPTIMGDFAEHLAQLARQSGAGLMVTPSRRTGPDNEAILRARLRGLPAVIWDGQGDNPYFAFLGLADAIVVTCDSVSMVSEACSTGKPVYLVGLEGGSAKFRGFHEKLFRDRIARPFDGTFETWSYPPLEDTARIAAEIVRRLGAGGLSRAV